MTRVAGGTRAAGGLLAGVLLVGAAACGVPQESEPRALERSAAPFRLFDDEPVAQEPTSDLQAELYFVRLDRLAATTRPVPQPGTAEQIAQELFEGLTEQERTAGLSSAIPNVVSLEGVEVQNGIAVVSLDGFEESVRTDQVTAFAQIVATLEALPDIDGVRFRTGDLDLPVPRGDGVSTDAPLSRSDYPVLLGPAPSAPPATVASPEPAGSAAATEDAPSTPAP